MKLRVLIASLIITLLSIGMVAAQTNVPEIPEDINGVMVQTAASGTLVENDDDTYTLTLVSDSDLLTVLLDAPELGAGFYPVVDLENDWNAADDLVGWAVLHVATEDVELADLTFLLAIGGPTIGDDMTYSYTVTIEEIASSNPDVDPTKDIIAPDEFGTATLFILLDYDFVTELEAGRLAVIDDVRLSTAQPCFPGRSC